MKFNSLNYLGTRWKVGAKIRRSRAWARPGRGQFGEFAQISNIQKETISITWEIEKENYNYNIWHILQCYEIQ